MSVFLSDLDLPERWGCSVEVELTPDGFYDGRGELWHDGTHCCVIAISRQLTRDATLERANFWATHFIEEWAT